MRNVRILMPVLHYWPVVGGLENWTQNIAQGLSDKAEIFVVTGRVKRQPLAEIKKGVRVLRTSFFPLANLSYSSPLYILSALPFIFLKSISLIKKEKIKLLHCQGFTSSVLGHFLSLFAKIPYIVTVQREESNFLKFLKKRVYSNAKLCIAASSAIEKNFQKFGAKNIEIIPNGIDLEKFKGIDRQESRSKLGLNDKFIIMTVARLEKVKGIEYLVEAAKNFQFPISKFKLLIIGDGSERDNLEDLVRKLDLKEKVKFLGQIPNKEIPGYLAAADCFVLPSLREGFGIVLLEAQAAEVPVIGTKVGGIPDIIEDKKTGLLVDPKNPEAIGQAVSKIYSDAALARKLVENAKLNLEKYNWQNIAEKVYEIYIRYTNISA